MLLLLSVNRGLFIIDPSGVVRQVTINDLPVGRSVEEVLRLVKAFQFTDEHGEGNFMKPFLTLFFRIGFCGLVLEENIKFPITRMAK